MSARRPTPGTSSSSVTRGERVARRRARRRLRTRSRHSPRRSRRLRRLHRRRAGGADAFARGGDDDRITARARDGADADARARVCGERFDTRASARAVVDRARPVRARSMGAHFAFAHHVPATARRARSRTARTRRRRRGGVADDVPRVLARARSDDDDEGVPCVVPSGKTVARVRGDARRASVRGGAAEGLAREERVDGGEARRRRRRPRARVGGWMTPRRAGRMKALGRRRRFRRGRRRGEDEDEEGGGRFKTRPRIRMRFVASVVRGFEMSYAPAQGVDHDAETVTKDGGRFR